MACSDEVNGGTEVKIYTDGACSGNPGAGGYGVVMLWRGSEKCLSGNADATTNNRMELMAAICGLEALHRPMRVMMYTDSKYVKDGIERWLEKWLVNGWRTSSKGEVKNRDLWERLHGALRGHDVSWHWVKGHSGDYYNDLADKLAVDAIGGG